MTDDAHSEAGAATYRDGPGGAPPGPGCVGWLSDDMRRLTDMLGIAAPQPTGRAAREKLDTLSSEFEGLLDSQLTPEEQQRFEEEERLVRLWRSPDPILTHSSHDSTDYIFTYVTYLPNAQHLARHPYQPSKNHGVSVVWFG